MLEEGVLHGVVAHALEGDELELVVDGRTNLENAQIVDEFRCAIEFSGLQPDEVVRIVESRSMGRTGTPKSGVGRTVPMAPGLAQALATLSLRDVMTAPTDRVFIGRDGGHVDRDSLRERFEKAQDHAKVTPHRKLRQLRNTFGTICASSGDVSMRTLQAWMGHQSIATTEIYASFMPRAEDAAVIARAFQGLD